jgi:hypothetical protein
MYKYGIKIGALNSTSGQFRAPVLDKIL